MRRVALRFASPLLLFTFLILVVGVSAEPQRTADKSLVVSTTIGQLQGIARPGGGAEFLGIPYAQPPIGNLRWREPVSTKPWTGVREATKFGAPCSQPDLGTAADQWTADMIFRCPAVTQATWHAAAGNATYEYEFNHAIPGQKGAVHSGDLPYVFGFYPKSGNISGKFAEVDTRLSGLIETYWTNFAKSGNPNGPDLPNWPQQDDTGVYIQFQQDGSVEKATGLRSTQCNLYRDWLSARSHIATKQGR